MPPEFYMVGPREKMVWDDIGLKALARDWLAIVFASVGLFAPRNPTSIVVLLLCSLAVSGGIFLIEELDNPFSGLIQIPSDSMRKALVEISR